MDVHEEEAFKRIRIFKNKPGSVIPVFVVGGSLFRGGFACGHLHAHRFVLIR